MIDGRRRRLQDALIAWSDATRRDLPWRTSRDPWAILVSEVMLQQTQVSRVEPRYHEFLAVFPTPAACAAASVAEVVRKWAGLGYNRRAVNLHRTAEAVVADHAGALPDELASLMALPGVGPYTARAVLAFAFEHDHGVVDTNAARFLARAVAGRRLSAGVAQREADGMVPASQAWAWNQAVLDLGATICIRRAPRCGECPVATECAWRAAGGADPADGSAGVSTPQTRFEGSDRQGRGRIVAALRAGPVDVARVADIAGWGDDPSRARRIADSLVRDGLAEYADGALVLPG